MMGSAAADLLDIKVVEKSCKRSYFAKFAQKLKCDFVL